MMVREFESFEAEKAYWEARGFYTGTAAAATIEDHTEAAAAAGHQIYCYEVRMETGSKECRCEPEPDESEY